MNIEKYNNPVAENIVKAINERGLKQCAVAQKAGYQIRDLSNMLNGRKIIRALDVVKLSKALDVDPNFLFGIHKEKE